MARLLAHPWPGNIRELENVIERCTLFCDTDRISLGDLPPELAGTLPTTTTLADTPSSEHPPELTPGLKEAVRQAAAREHRSVANMIEMLIRRHCDQSGITIPEQSDFFPGTPNG